MKFGKKFTVLTSSECSATLPTSEKFDSTIVEFDGEHEGIIDEKKFIEVQKLMDARKEKPRRGDPPRTRCYLAARRRWQLRLCVHDELREQEEKGRQHKTTSAPRNRRRMLRGGVEDTLKAEKTDRRRRIVAICRKMELRSQSI